MRLTGLVSKCAFKDWQCVANAIDRLALREPIDGLLTLRASGIVTPVQDDYNLRGRTPKAEIRYDAAMISTRVGLRKHPWNVQPVSTKDQQSKRLDARERLSLRIAYGETIHSFLRDVDRGCSDLPRSG